MTEPDPQEAAPDREHTTTTTTTTTTTDPTAALPALPVLAVGLSQKVETLVDKLDAIEERRLMDRRLWLVGIGVVVTMSVLSLVVVITSVIISSSNRNTVKAIESCTTPGGECYERNQSQTAGVVQLLLQQNIAIAECSKSTNTEPQLEACVEMKLRQLTN